MASIVLRNPAMAGAVVFVAVAVVPTVLVLTTDREPAAVVQSAPVRADGCVMFCPPVPASGVVLSASVTTQAPPKAQGCVMFCDSRGPETPTQECGKLCAKPRPRVEGGDRR
ncbi:hypothetical protein ACWDYH_01895 [Nocardia goodfellowii]